MELKGKIKPTRMVIPRMEYTGVIKPGYPYVFDGKSYIIIEGYETLVWKAPRQLAHRLGDKVKITIELEEDEQPRP